MPKTYTCRDGNAGFLLGQSPLPSPPPLREYMMPRDAEIALARSAAPANISDRATIKVLTPSGYRVVHEGNNGFVCMVMRGWTAPTYTPAQLRGLVYDASIHAPICFNPEAARTVVPYYKCEANSGWRAKGLTRSPQVFRRRTPQASYPGETR